MRKKTRRQTKIQKNEVTKIRTFMKGVTKATPKMINKAQQAAMHYMNVRNAILEEVLRERTGLKTIPLTDDQKRRLAQAGVKVDELTLGKIEHEFRPETVYGWYNKLVGNKYNSVGDGQKKRGPKTITDELRDAILKMSMENPAWGYQRIANYLVYLGFDVTFMTVKRVLDNYGIFPPDDPHRGGDWHNFIESHRAITAACDFVTYEMPQENGELQRAHIFFFENLATREVWCGGIAVNPDAQWMAQVARNQTDCFSGKLLNFRYLIHDGDPLFKARFPDYLSDIGCKSKRIPPRCPEANGYVESFIKTFKTECLNHLIITSVEQLRYVVSEFLLYYNHERPHSGLSGKLIAPWPQPTHGEIRCFSRLGGLLKSYRRVA